MSWKRGIEQPRDLANRPPIEHAIRGNLGAIRAPCPGLATSAQRATR